MNQQATPESPIYHRLNHQDREIRLLELLPRLRNGRIECRLSTSHLDAADFVVLSYQWGTSAATYEIVLNGQIFRVRQNLWDFLNVFREQPPMYLWIDALCINQGDIDERNQQVGIMGQIFQSAGMVLSWLGATNVEVERAFELMLSVCSPPATANEPEHLPVLTADQLEEDLWRCIAELCSVPYWNRIWVVQEILLSSNNYLLCGRKTLPWQVFANFISLVDVRFTCPPQYAQTIHTSNARSYALSKPYAMIPWSLQWTVGHALKHDFGKPWDVGEHSLFSILTMFGDRDCTDQLDHVYALLALTDEGGGFPVRYGIDQTELFLSLLHFCGNLAVLEQDDLSQPLLLQQTTQRAFIRNAKHVAETLGLVTFVQRTQPYYPGYGGDTRTPPSRPNPCFPCADQVLVLQCSTIVPGSEPPILRSNTLRRSISRLGFERLVHVDESSSWLICRRQSHNADHLTVMGVITIKESSQGRGFRILECDKSTFGLLTPTHDQEFTGKWVLSIPPEKHINFLKIVILGQQP